jgi:HEPN domain-containing protein
MTPNEFLLDETRQWLAKAYNDLRAAEVALVNDLAEVALYHCQQAAEKSLKAFLVFRQEPFRKTHNLKELGEACLALDADLPPSVRESFRLTEYAWMFRYPGAPRDIEEGEAETALRLARRLYEDIAGRLPADART